MSNRRPLLLFVVASQGLDNHDRSVVESLFLEQKIQVLVCTSTLACKSPPPRRRLVAATAASVSLTPPPLFAVAVQGASICRATW